MIDFKKRLRKLYTELEYIELLRWAVVSEIEMIDKCVDIKPRTVKMTRLQYQKQKKSA